MKKLWVRLTASPEVRELRSVWICAITTFSLTMDDNGTSQPVIYSVIPWIQTQAESIGERRSIVRAKCK